MPLTGCSPSNPTGGPGAAQPCSGATATCPLALPSTPPANCPAAPAQVKLPANVNSSMQTSFTNSFPGGKSQERGGTLVRDAGGNVKVIHESTGTTGTFSPNRTAGPGETIIGTYHTHPYDASEGGHKGVSFSGADIYYASHYKEPIYVDAGDRQFMIMPTQATPAMDPAVVNAEWEAERQKAVAAGKSFPESSREASNAIAKKYNMAYYEGSNGTLNRVSC